MNPFSKLGERPLFIFQTLSRHRYLWLVPTAVCTLGALVAALLGSKSWQATQPIVVRDELVGNSVRMGRFESLDAMKTAQETIYEIARNPSVLKEVMQRVGPPSSTRSKAWPSEEDIADFRDAISITAPNGAEFGHTEVLHLNVKAPSREYAARFVAQLIEQVDRRLRQLRDERAQSMESEMTQTVKLSKDSLTDAVNKLQEIENQVGADLGELRSLNDPSAGDSNLRKALAEIRQELRLANKVLQAANARHEQLVHAMKEPAQALAATNSIFASHPSLLRLKNGMIEAQMRRAKLVGDYSPQHPVVVAAEQTITEIRAQLQTELRAATSGANYDLQLASQRARQLETMERDLAIRLERLSSLRIRYSNLLDAVTERKKVLSTAEKNLVDVQASRQAAQSASVIGQIDSPQVGIRPLGPSKKAIVLGGFVGGLIIGIGLVIFVSAPTPGQSQENHSQPTPADSATPARQTPRGVAVFTSSTASSPAMTMSTEYATSHTPASSNISNQLAEEVAQLRRELRQQAQASGNPAAAIQIDPLSSSTPTPDTPAQ